MGPEDEAATASFVNGRLHDATSAPERRKEEALPSAKGDETPPPYRRDGSCPSTSLFRTTGGGGGSPPSFDEKVSDTSALLSVFVRQW